MPSDLGLNQNLEVFINARGDLAMVDGEAAFEQELAIRLTTVYNELLGEADEPTIRDKMRLEAKRVHRKMDRLRSLSSLEIIFEEQGEDEHKAAIVTIIYDTGETLDFTVS
jgi:CRISPR/Cas system endoribonuclease Cas6 (RAMP superfamily)